MRISKLAAGALAAFLVALSGGEARAADATFGSAGDLVVSWDQPLVSTTVGQQVSSISPLFFSYATASNNGGNGGNVTTFGIAPAADVFVIDNLSVGGQLLFLFTAPSAGNNTTSFGFAPQVGYNIALSDSISLWPKVFFGFENQSSNGASGSITALGAFVPFDFHVAKHFFLGIGPDFTTQLSVPGNGSKLTSFGLTGTFGGWFNLGGG